MLPSSTVATAGMETPSFAPHWRLYPRTYAVTRAPDAFLHLIDGDLTKPAWQSVPWSDDFDDIRGPDDVPSPDDRPNPACRTRFKAMWDDTHVYLAALLESDFSTQAHFTERNDPIYQKDSDFEVFVDPLGCCHHYKEFEVNALNTVWNLMLDKPYNDGGREYSGRVAEPGDELYYEVYGQKSATRVVKGRLNDPNGQGATWSVEIAMSYKDLLARVASDASPPRPGTLWRVNFSRVERRGDTNWTWQPQIVWDPPSRRYSGFVQMHLPDTWGYFAFVEYRAGDVSGQLRAGDDGDPPHGDSPDGTHEGTTLQTPYRDPTWPARLAALNVYYAQHSFRHRTGRFAQSVSELKDLVDQAILDPFDVEMAVSEAEDTFRASVSGSPDGSVVSVTGDRHVSVSNTEYLPPSPGESDLGE